jgi:hypothetical protein
MAAKQKDPLTTLLDLAERVAELEKHEELHRRGPLSASLDRPGTLRNGNIITIGAAGFGLLSQAETTSAYGPDGLPVRDTRPAAIPVRPRIRHSRVRG